VQMDEINKDQVGSGVRESLEDAKGRSTHLYLIIGCVVLVFYGAAFFILRSSSHDKVEHLLKRKVKDSQGKAD
jgi:hypothetical protein